MDVEIITRMNEVFPRESRVKAAFRVALLVATILAAPGAAAQPAPSPPLWSEWSRWNAGR
jgi:hypothetical protein